MDKVIRMIGRSLTSLALVVLAASSPPARAAQSPPDRPAAAAAGAAASGTDGSAYPLGPGDKVRITVYGEQELTGPYNITSAGDISFPLIGNVHAAGQSTVALQETIRAKLAAGYILDPRVSAEVLDYRPFYILGEVSKPGQYPYSNGMTIQQAVATAGGFTYRANIRKIFIKHTHDSAETVVSLRKSDPIAVAPGDTIRVAERFF